MFSFVVWLIYGLLIGFISKKLYPGEEPAGWIPTMLIGVAGSYVGGFAYYLLTERLDAFRPGGFLLSILGGVIFIYFWKSYNNVK
jgi:uncharacterized membrane protein YeaQ/YmgE (transglycosylase-associated protein family)